MSDKTSKKLQLNAILPWIELISAIVLGLVLYFPLEKKDLADIVWVLGLLLTFNNIALIKVLKDEISVMHKIVEIVDLSQKCDIDRINRILHLYLSIKETEFGSLKDEIIQKCFAQLNSLAHEKTTVANGGEYYMWLLNMVRLCSRGDQVMAISIMVETAWTELLAETAYLDENINAVKRGVVLERIFISSKQRMLDKRNREVIYKHLEYREKGMFAYIVWLDELIGQDPKLVQEIGDGLVVFGKRVALIDTYTAPNEAQGTITMHSERIKHYERLFERLKLHAREVDANFFQRMDNERKIP